MAYPQKTFHKSVIHPTSLVGRRRDAVATNTLLYQLDVLKKTGRYDAFKLQWHPSYSDPPLVWPIPNHLFWDSDVAKWIEGACYFMKQQPNETVDAAVREMVSMIRSAQQPDGYLNIHYTVVEPGKRFTNLRDFHELYNAGHLIEAALAHQDHYQNDLLMEPILKYVDLLVDQFGPGEAQFHGYPGHPEIELALLRLYDHTRNGKHLTLARYFLTERGNPKGWEGRHYYDVEAERRGEDPDKHPAFYPKPRSMWYHQAHLPIEEQQSIEGHSVRAVYLLTAVADLLRLEGWQKDNPFKAAMYRLWENMVERKMYVTGGIGAIRQWEGFGQDYYLPQGVDEGGCYSETCAAIGVMMLAERILKVRLDATIADIMELCLYNAVLTSMSHDGKRFTYVNQLASSDGDLSRREEWFTCACCPPNVLRLLGQIGGYVWSCDVGSNPDSAKIVVHLYISSTMELEVGSGTVKVTQESEWPWAGDVKFWMESPSQQIGMKLRIPSWATSHAISPNCPNVTLENGYLHIPAEWLSSNPSFVLSIPLGPRLIAPHPLTNQNTITLARGPIIYCVEDVDNPWVQDHFKTLQIRSNCKIEEHAVTDSESGDRFVGLKVTHGASVYDAESFKVNPSIDASALETAIRGSRPLQDLAFVPYYFRANRGGKGHMRVGLRSAGNPTAGGRLHSSL